MQIAIKLGIGARDGKTDIRGDPEYVRAYCDSSLKWLDVEYIDLFYAHRINTHVPIEVTVSYFFDTTLMPFLPGIMGLTI